ncbi:MAG: shikimate kinase [Alphaproteobacteria bacterium]
MTSEKAKSSFVPARSVVLVGMMGSGKSSIGRRLAARLALPFADSDAEIERAAGCSVQEFFARYGEAEFRAGECRVISRLLEGGVMVLATGGGAFIQEDTRAVIRARGISVWLKADADILISRVGKGRGRPVLQRQHADPAQAMRELLVVREPIYATADITVVSGNHAPDVTVERIIETLADQGISGS